MEGVFVCEESPSGPTLISKCDMSFDSRTTVMGFGVLPERCRLNIPRDSGGSKLSRISGESVDVSWMLVNRVLGDEPDVRRSGLGELE